MANRFDFMDSDGIEKSITGTVLKNAAQIAPYFIPYVNVGYAAANIAIELADTMPVLIKGIAGLLESDLSDNEILNQTQAFARKMKGDVSDYSKQKAFSFENIGNIVSDTFDQLYSQRLIASIPGLLGSKSNQIARYRDELNNVLGGENYAKFLSMTGDEQMSALRKMASTNNKINKLMKQQEFWNTTGAKRLSSLYMAATSSTQAYDEAKAAGFDQIDASIYHMAVFGGMFALINNTEIGHWALKGLGTDDVSKGINGLMKTESNKMIQSLSASKKMFLESTKEAKKRTQWMSEVLNTGKQTALNTIKKLATGDINTIVESALAEGIEEMSEELMQDVFKVGINTFHTLGISSTKGKEAGFQFSPQDIMQRYAMSFVGGGLGGAIFKLNDNLLNNTKSNQIDKDLTWYLSNGYKDKVDEIHSQMKEDGVFASTVLKPNVVYSDDYNFDKPSFESTTDKT